MQKNITALTFFIVLLSLMISGVSHGFLGFGDSPTKVKASNGEVRLPLKKISDGKAHHYSFKAEGKEIAFFVVKSPDGVIRAAFDACDVCYHAKKGYSQQGDFMICNNCGMKFHSARINVVKGGCNPSPLKRTVNGEYLVIRVEDIQSGAGYF